MCTVHQIPFRIQIQLYGQVRTRYSVSRNPKLSTKDVVSNHRLLRVVVWSPLALPQSRYRICYAPLPLLHPAAAKRSHTFQARVACFNLPFNRSLNHVTLARSFCALA